MSDQLSIKLSESEEMYLETIASIVEDETLEIVPLSQLADRLNIHVVSANQMIRKLEEEGLVNYYPYKGVKLTDIGRKIALQKIRNRRLWEVFLVNYLEIPLDEASKLACGLEHITNEEVCLQLAKFLEFPKFDPYGKPIPECMWDRDVVPQMKWFALIEARLDDQLIVRQVKADLSTRAFLASEGIYPGAEITVAGIGDRGGYLLALKQTRFQVNKKVAEQILVRKNRMNAMELEQ
ncbi:MAG: metal-dependent transcriptional regulator [Anaerolineaceae bacterium]|nr:metal-dependent transcriptional regulator [Anaerolineaceae bacterium]